MLLPARPPSAQWARHTRWTCFLFNHGALTRNRDDDPGSLGQDSGARYPRRRPMADPAFAAANILVGNPVTTEGLEIVLLSGVGCPFR
ncbi:hypothetical protein B0H34DRAFT_725475, partial [Crassisporium funariophilum]